MKGAPQTGRADICAAVKLRIPEAERSRTGIPEKDILILIQFFETLDQWDRDAENHGKVV